MRFPEEYIEREKIDREALEVMRNAPDEDENESIREYQAVLRESSAIVDALPPSAWGLAEGTFIFTTGDVGIDPTMFRISRDTVERHDGKDWWFPEREFSAKDLVWKLRRGSAMLMSKLPLSFDNYAEGL